MTFEQMRDNAARDPRPNRVLAVAKGKKFFVLYHEGQAVEEALREETLDVMIEDEPVLDGVVVWEGGWGVTGTSDWSPSIPEYGLVGTWREATQEEWNNYLADEFVWEIWRNEDAD